MERKEIDKWLERYFQENLISTICPEAKILERLLTTETISKEGGQKQIIIKFSGGLKRLTIDSKDFPLIDKNVAVVGVGMIARLVHVPALVSIGVNIKYLVDTDKRKAEELAKLCGAKPLESVKELQGSGIDYAVVCTPPQYHPVLVRNIMEMGFDCFVEKPIALTTEDAKSMIEVAERTKKKLLVGHMRHWDPHYEKIQSLAKSRNCKILRRCFQSAPLWRGKKCRDSILEDGVVHDLDLLRIWLGEPKKFRVVTNKKDHVIIQLQFDGREAEIDDRWIGAYTKLPLLIEFLNQVIGKTFYNKIWEVRAPSGERIYHYHEKDRMPLVAYQAEHYELLTFSSGDDLRYKAEDALRTMELVEAIQGAPLDCWVKYK